MEFSIRLGTSPLRSFQPTRVRIEKSEAVVCMVHRSRQKHQYDEDADNDGELTKDEILYALKNNPECRMLIAEEPSLLPLFAPETYEAAFQITLQNSTEHAMFERHRSSRASSLRTDVKIDVHYFHYSAFAFKSNEIIKLMMPGST